MILITVVILYMCRNNCGYINSINDIIWKIIEINFSFFGQKIEIRQDLRFQRLL